MRDVSLTVTQLNEYVRRSLAADPMLRNIIIVGEISNFKRHVSGHWYFTLKDEEAAINCAMFRQAAMDVRFRPENGQRVRLSGSVGLYSKTGSYQFYADRMEPEGLGDLYLRFEALKRKLADEGLFDPSIKKALPLFPRGVGIVTSKTGAVVHDITRVSWRRFPGMPLYLAPVKVQGEGAAREIANGLLLLDSMPEIDVIIVGRGGGSMEDLWPFNEEQVARAIAMCHTPVISAVGHETDFTIADFVADVRAATPSAAAELAVPELETLIDSIQMVGERLQSAVERQVTAKRIQLAQLQTRMTEHSPVHRSTRSAASLAALNVRMDAAIQHSLVNRTKHLDNLSLKLTPAVQAAFMQKKHRMEKASLRLRTSGPVESMKRGYAVVTQNGQLVRGVKQLAIGDPFTVEMIDGSVDATVNTLRIKE